MNLYWPIYKNLERQLLEVAEIIHFDDDQEKVYSIHIADLLIRTAVEIEALAKHLYEINGGDMKPVTANGSARDLYFDTDCIQFLGKKWAITKKVVNVVAANFYYEKDENRILRPLKDCNKAGKGRWKNAYEAVKHDRVESLERGNIGNLIRAMAALYLLNLYNMEDKIAELGLAEDYKVDSKSEVFSVNTYSATSINMGLHMNDKSIIRKFPDDPAMSKEACVYIDRYTEASYFELHQSFMKDEEITNQNAQRSVALRKFLEAHPDYSDMPLTLQCIACGEEMERERLGITGDILDAPEEIRTSIKNAGFDMVKEIRSFLYSSAIKNIKREIVLNKMQPIYPEI